MAMAEKQATPRQELEGAALKGNLAAQKRGQAFALVVVLAGIVAGTILILMGKAAEGLASIFGPLAIAAAIFITGRYAQERERREKLNRLDQVASRSDDAAS